MDHDLREAERYARTHPDDIQALARFARLHLRLNPPGLPETLSPDATLYELAEQAQGWAKHAIRMLTRYFAGRMYVEYPSPWSDYLPSDAPTAREVTLSDVVLVYSRSAFRAHKLVGPRTSEKVEALLRSAGLNVREIQTVAEAEAGEMEVMRRVRARRAAAKEARGVRPSTAPDVSLVMMRVCSMCGRQENDHPTLDHAFNDRDSIRRPASSTSHPPRALHIDATASYNLCVARDENGKVVGHITLNDGFDVSIAWMDTAMLSPEFFARLPITYARDIPIGRAAVIRAWFDHLQGGPSEPLKTSSPSDVDGGWWLGD